ncbi:MAG: hypothetical protein DIU80_009855 [Chloroflexota bacterium]
MHPYDTPTPTLRANGIQYSQGSASGRDLNRELVSSRPEGVSREEIDALITAVPALATRYRRATLAGNQVEIRRLRAYARSLFVHSPSYRYAARQVIVAERRDSYAAAPAAPACPPPSRNRT